MPNISSLNYRTCHSSILRSYAPNRRQDDTDGFVSKFFTPREKKRVVGIIDLSGSAISLVRLPVGRCSRRYYEFEIVFIPKGNRFTTGQYFTYGSQRIIRRGFDIHLATKVFEDFVTHVLSKSFRTLLVSISQLLQQHVHEVAEVVAVPNGFVAAFSSHASHREGIYEYSTVSKKIRIISNSFDLTRRHEVYEEAIRLQSIVGNEYIFTPSLVYKTPAILLSIENNNVAQVRDLLSVAFDQDCVLRYIECLFLVDFSKIDPVMIEYAISVGFDVFSYLYLDETLMHHAVYFKNSAVAAFLLDIGFDLEKFFGGIELFKEFCLASNSTEIHGIVCSRQARQEARSTIHEILGSKGMLQ